MGKKKYVQLVKERVACFKLLKDGLKAILEPYGEKVLESPSNKISIAFTIGKLCQDEKFKGDPTYFGSYLFKRRVMGARVVGKTPQKLEGINFNNYGSHAETYPHLPYITVASAIGSKAEEVQNFLDLMKKLLPTKTSSPKIEPSGSGGSKKSPSKSKDTKKQDEKTNELEQKDATESQEVTPKATNQPVEADPTQQPAEEISKPTN